MERRSDKGDPLVPREIKEVEGGYYDDMGFYILPDGGKSLNSINNAYF